MEPLYPDINVRLIGEDGNAGAIMGRVARALKRGGIEASKIHEFRMECLAGNYDQLLQTVMKWVTTDPDED